jgi:DNA-binding CsgD family transcriptional regulator
MLAALQKLEHAAAADALSFPVRDELGTAVMVGHVMPVRLAAHDIFANSLAMLFLTPLASSNILTTDLMRSLFDLTVAETRIAKGLAGGQTLQEIAQEGDVSFNTVRTQLRSILEKTGCKRQPELVALLANVAMGQPQAAEQD